MKKYNYDEALSASLEYFSGDELAANVFVNKYALRDNDGDFVELTPDDMHRRLAKEFARIEEKYPNPMSESDIYDLLKGFKKIIPQGSPMSAIGNNAKVQSLSNCFVIEAPSDSYGSIARADEEILQIQKRRGGVGVDISNIRPRGVAVKNAAGTSDGIAIFMERYSNTTREVAQGGRRGALMETIDVRHPDVEQFITIKQDRKRVTGANVSLRVTDEFMQCVEQDLEFSLRWPVESSVEDAKLVKNVRARDIWDKMMFAAWDSAEPGVIYWDTVLKTSMADEFADKGYKTICTNPCVTGETTVQTSAGEKTVKELVDTGITFNVRTYDEITKQIVEKQATAFKTRDSAKVFKLKLKNGKSIRLTADHLVYTERGWIRTDQLEKTDKILSISDMDS